MNDVTGTVAGAAIDRFATLIAVILVGIAGVFLSIAWTYGPFSCLPRRKRSVIDSARA